MYKRFQMKRQERINVLIVSEAEANREMLKEFLKKEYEIVTVADGEEALQILEAEIEEISLILLDMDMSNQNDFDLLQIINEKGWQEYIPVIIISSRYSTKSVIKGYEYGVVDYIQRPFNTCITLRRIENIIALYTRQRNLEEIISEQIARRERQDARMVDILSTLVEFRNDGSGVHVKHMRTMTEILLVALMNKDERYKMTLEKIAEIANAAAFHDIGKIAVPEQLLNKLERLTLEEFELVKAHAQKGAQMLEGIDEEIKDSSFLHYAKEICRWHHERFDGRGYPDGLIGDKIPVSAQVVGLAHVYDALTSERAYRKAYSHQEAVRMILRGECGVFNPDLMECFMEEQTNLRRQIEILEDTQEQELNT